jgi:UDP-glucose:glycoprotein glucosyltransferase
MVLCSHKKNVLDFLDKFCSFYEQRYIFTSSKSADNTQAFLDTVYELAEANGLPSNTFKSALTEFSIDHLRKHLNKVYDCCLLASRCFYSSV